MVSFLKTLVSLPGRGLVFVYDNPKLPLPMRRAVVGWLMLKCALLGISGAIVLPILLSSGFLEIAASDIQLKVLGGFWAFVAFTAINVHAVLLMRRRIRAASSSS